MWFINFSNLFKIYGYRRFGIKLYKSFFWFIAEKFLGLLALFQVDRLYAWYVRNFTKSRKLSADERRLAATIFRGTLDYDKIRIREQKRFGTFGGTVVYASIDSINAGRMLDRKTLIHELVHLWQYRKYGVSYIVRALAAQHTHEGYDYGGEEFYKDLIRGRRKLSELNYEQMASAIEDFYAQLYLNTKSHKLGSGELWEIDKRIRNFLLSVK